MSPVSITGICAPLILGDAILSNPDLSNPAGAGRIRAKPSPTDRVA
jgi:hypothetical protein